ncbi:hypothetical protein FQN54_004449 [Arachnomyces sp. PD_36]|nr:hypothetical protein FQN54_004449 [Arachnomyces sp. PD_36]
MKSLSLFATSLAVAATGAAGAATTTFPDASGETALPTPSVISGAFDGGMVRYNRDPDTCEGQSETDEDAAMFIVEDGGSISNVIIGKAQENVWWEDVCEDAATFKQTDGTSNVIGGGARGADDKIFQFNGRGTVSITDFYAEDYGKVLRSCGDCTDNGGPRNVIIDGVIATDGGPLCGINTNFGAITITMQNLLPAFTLSLLTFSSNVLAGTGVTFQDSSETTLRVDTGSYGPAIEEVHYFYQDWPVGFAVSSDDRVFVSYYPGNVSFTLGEVVNSTTEKAYLPEYHVAPDKRSQAIGDVVFGSQNATGLISVQALHVTPKDPERPEMLWVLDTGRPNVPGETVYALPGGTKLVAVNLEDDTVVRTYTFPSSVNYPDSSLNDMRIDFNPGLTPSGKGVAYLSDESPEGRNGIVVLDLGTGESWRHLDRHPAGLVGYSAVPSYQGIPFYPEVEGEPFKTLPHGLDGIQLDPTGSTLYFSSMTTDYLYSIETKYLLDHTSHTCIQAANAAVRNLGGRGGNGNGFEGDSNGLIYQAMPEHNAVYAYDPVAMKTIRFLRDPRIIWPDGLAVSEDGYVYIIINQLPYQPMWNDGKDLRQPPGALLRAKLPNGGSKIKTLV